MQSLHPRPGAGLSGFSTSALPRALSAACAITRVSLAKPSRQSALKSNLCGGSATPLQTSGRLAAIGIPGSNKWHLACVLIRGRGSSGTTASGRGQSGVSRFSFRALPWRCGASVRRSCWSPMNSRFRSVAGDGKEEFGLRLNVPRSSLPSVRRLPSWQRPKSASHGYEAAAGYQPGPAGSFRCARTSRRHRRQQGNSGARQTDASRWVCQASAAEPPWYPRRSRRLLGYAAADIMFASFLLGLPAKPARWQTRGEPPPMMPTLATPSLSPESFRLMSLRRRSLASTPSSFPTDTAPQNEGQH
jgi:hypothetical protein